MSEPLWYIREQQNRESAEAMDDDVMAVGDADFESMRENVEEGEEDDFFDPDPEVELRKQVFNEVMERHPEFAFTGASVSDYIYNGGDLESATQEDAHLEMAYEDRYIEQDY